MYYLVQKKKNMPLPEAHYSFKSFKEMYELTDILTVPIFGRYTFIIKTEKVSDITEFISQSHKYDEFIVYIVTPKNIIDTLTLRYPQANVQDNVSEYKVFLKLVEKHEVLFRKGVVDVLYKSIEHSYETMDSLLFEIKQKYGLNEVTEKDLSELVVLNKTVYPRTVVLSFLKMERWRYQKLRKCVEQMGNEVVYYSMVKAVKELVKDKTSYLKTSIAKGNIKFVSTQNLILMYNVLVLNKTALHDVEILMRLYEEGVTANDFVQTETI